MKIIISKKILTSILIFIIASNAFSQIRDKWDTIYKYYNYDISGNKFVQNGILSFNNKLFLYGDSIDGLTVSSKIKLFNPTTNTLTGISYTKELDDIGISCATSYSNTHAYFGMKDDYLSSASYPTVYHYNASTGAVNSLTINVMFPGDYIGINNMVNYSANSSVHDTMIVFTTNISFGNHIEIFKHKIGSTNFIATTHTIGVQNIDKAFVYGNKLFISSYLGGKDTMMFSTDGVTFTGINPNDLMGPILNFSIKLLDMDTIHGKLYYSFEDQTNNLYKISYSNNPLAATTGSLITIVDAVPGRVLSFEKYKNQLWYNVGKQGPLAKSFASSGYANTVYYINSINDTIRSIDDIGVPTNDQNSYKLANVDNKLILSGNYVDDNENYYGPKLFKLLSPISNFLSSGTNTICLNSSKTFSSTCLNTDSVRWIYNWNNYFSTNSNISISFTIAVTYTVGLIAFGGTQSDTLKNYITVSAPALAVSASPSIICETKISTLNAIGAITYTWMPGLLSGPTPTVSPLTSTQFTVSGTNALGCIASKTLNLTVNPSTNVSGNVTNGAIPVAGYVTIYAYEPMYTKFDSITSIIISGSGAYTFTNSIPSNNYIVKATPSSSTLQITYGNSDVNWKTADIFSHTCAAPTTTANINVISLTPIVAGIGSLSGKIEKGPGFGLRTNGSKPLGTPIKGISVKGGRNPGGNIVAQTTTDANGTYTLSGLPNDNYFILVDIAGLDTNGTYHKVLTTGSENFTNLDFTVDSTKINPINLTVDINEINLDDDQIIIFPNPTSNLLNINFTLNRISDIKIDLFDLLGKSVKTILDSNNQSVNSYQTSSSINDLDSGIYFIKIKINEKEKIIKILITK